MSDTNNVIYTQLSPPSEKKFLKDFKTRFIVSLILLFFCAILLFLSSLSDQYNHWSIIKNRDFRFSIAVLLVILLSLLVFLIQKESMDLFLKKSNKLLYWYFSILSFLFLVTFSLLYLIPYYEYIEGVSIGYPGNDQIKIQHNIISEWVSVPLISTFLAYLLIVLLNLIFVLKKFNVCKIRYFIFYFYINIVIVFGIAGAIYAITVAGWTTFFFFAQIAICNDIFAYVFGSKYGKRKIFPNISPSKTLGGAVFGVFFTILFSIVILLLYSISTWTVDPSDYKIDYSYWKGLEWNDSLQFRHGSGYDPYHILTNIFIVNFTHGENARSFFVYWWFVTIILIVIYCVLELFGDLILSYFKRLAGVKDYGILLKKHGGILDRFDGMLFIFFIFFIFWIITCIISSNDLFNPIYNALPLNGLKNKL